MMLMLMKDGNPEECLEYWRQLVCVQGLNGVDISLETYNFAVKCTMALGNLDEMEAVVDMMQVCMYGSRLQRKIILSVGVYIPPCILRPD